MVVSGQADSDALIGVRYAPRGPYPNQPLEVLDRSKLITRIAGRELSSRQRAAFHQLILCTKGTGTHHVDYEAIHISPGTLLRIHPGQVQQFEPQHEFEATMIIWPMESHHPDPIGPEWYPGSQAPTLWQLDAESMANTLEWILELRNEQGRFDGSPRRIQLMQSMLCTLLLRLAIEQAEPATGAAHLPAPYLDFRELIEQRLHQRPTVASLARELGYSTRTLDRACQTVTGQTSKQVLDERIALEIRRLLTHTDQPLVRIATDLRFTDQSNFSKFVKRHTGHTPGDLRMASVVDAAH